MFFPEMSGYTIIPKTKHCKNIRYRATCQPLFYRFNPNANAKSCW